MLSLFGLPFVVGIAMDQIASQRFNSRVSSCEGKVPFKGQGLARQAAKRRDGRVAYRCSYCFQWHVGNPPPRVPKFEKRHKLIRLFLEPEWVTE